MRKEIMKRLDQELSIKNNDFFENKVSAFISTNLNPKLPLRPYQLEAIGRFIYYFETKSIDKKHIKLLFHMATGSGKTLIMAALILFLYQKGYRNFLFFVNNTNIINKTIDNFINKDYGKYLFSKKIELSGTEVFIKKVSHFLSTHTDDLNISFTTIHSLHNNINSPKENSFSFGDFKSEKTVFISDEAHHINAETKKRKSLSKQENEYLETWEHSVNKIVNANPLNMLLEFTATIDFSHTAIQEKYASRILFDYSLKKFRQAGYSKEVKVLMTNLEHFDRALQALVLSQYRKKIAKKNHLKIKPVILFKSKTIKESQSFFSIFLAYLRELKIADLERIKSISKAKIIQQAFSFFAKNDTSLQNLIKELQLEFSEEKCIEIHSLSDSVDKQLIINNLEAKTNLVRAVFAVDKLNEGWDVLNLFDIVRLGPSNDKPLVLKKTSMTEAQLIGRGARYFPIQFSATDDLFKRKLDNDLSNELRVCEELFYHCNYNPPYLKELDTALIFTGIKKAENEKTQAIRPNLHRPFQSYASLKKSVVPETYFQTNSNINNLTFQNIDYFVISKAMRMLKFYEFSNLKEYFPKLHSKNQFIQNSDYLADILILPSNPDNFLLDKELELKETLKRLTEIADLLRNN